MARNNQRSKRRDWRQTLFIIISVLIVLSMALALVLSFSPPPTN